MPFSRHLVDPVLLEAVDTFQPFEPSVEALAVMRASIAERFGRPVADDPTVSIETLTIAGAAGPIRVLAYLPRDARGLLPAVLHLHGGGFVMGVPELGDVQHRRLAAELGVAIYSVDYRLAPEHVWPAPLEDGLAVLGWLHAEAAALGLDPARIGVKGESAGGCLAAALALAARDRGDLPIAFQLLTFPALDDRTGSTHPPHPYCGEFLWTAALNKFGWNALLGQEPGGPDTPVYAAPVRATSLSGLPPTFIAVGALDLYLEENIEYARRLAQAGVPVELHVYPGAIHGFGLAPASWLERNAERDLADAMCRMIARAGERG